MRGHIQDNQVLINVNNIEEFDELIKQAEKELKQLSKTITELSLFKLNLKFDFDPQSSQ